MSHRRLKRRKRRGPGGVLRRVSLLLAAAGVVVVVGFVVSRVLTDRLAWSQWVWWVPTLWWAVVAWGILALSMLMGWMAKRRGYRGRVGRGTRTVLLGVLLVGCVGMLLNMVFGVQRWQNGVAMYGIHWTSVLENGRVRVMHWNLSAEQIDVDRTMEWIKESNIDVALIANPRWDGQSDSLMTGLRAYVGEEGIVRRLPRALVASRLELINSSMVYLSANGGEGSREDAMRSTGDFGWIALLRFDGGERFGEFDVWFVDLPSEPTVHRMSSIGEVVKLLRERDRALSPDLSPALSPALIMGDFNTVCGSASLGLFDAFEGGDGFVDAYEARGAFGGSWKPTGISGVQGWIAGRSSWQIDLSLVGNGWGVEGYELLIPDGSVWGNNVSHRAQVVDMERSN